MKKKKLIKKKSAKYETQLPLQSERADMAIANPEPNIEGFLKHPKLLTYPKGKKK